MELMEGILLVRFIPSVYQVNKLFTIIQESEQVEGVTRGPLITCSTSTENGREPQ